MRGFCREMSTSLKNEYIYCHAIIFKRKKKDGNGFELNCSQQGRGAIRIVLYRVIRVHGKCATTESSRIPGKTRGWAASGACVRSLFFKLFFFARHQRRRTDENKSFQTFPARTPTTIAVTRTLSLHRPRTYSS